MKLRIVLLFTVLLGLTASPSLALDVEGSASLAVFDKYLWRGIDLSDSTEVVQGAVELSTSGFTLTVWGNAQLEDDGAYDGGELNEVDVTLDYSVDVTDLLSVSAGNITYILKDIPDSNEAYLAATLNTLLAPTFTAYWDWDQAEENGLFYTVAISHTFEPCAHAAVNLGALVGYNDKSDYNIYYYDAATDADKSYSDWHNLELSAATEIKAGDQLTITPSLLYSTPLSNAAKRAIDSEWLGGVTLSYSASF